MDKDIMPQQLVDILEKTMDTDESAEEDSMLESLETGYELPYSDGSDSD